MEVLSKLLKRDNHLSMHYLILPALVFKCVKKENVFQGYYHLQVRYAPMT